MSEPRTFQPEEHAEMMGHLATLSPNGITVTNGDGTVTVTRATATPCASCDEPTEALDFFPGGICLDCYAASAEGRRMPTAAEVVAMWGGSAR